MVNHFSLWHAITFAFMETIGSTSRSIGDSSITGRPPINGYRDVIGGPLGKKKG